MSFVFLWTFAWFHEHWPVLLILHSKKQAVHVNVPSMMKMKDHGIVAFVHLGVCLCKHNVVHKNWRPRTSTRARRLTLEFWDEQVWDLLECLISKQRAKAERTERFLCKHLFFNANISVLNNYRQRWRSDLPFRRNWKISVLWRKFVQETNRISFLAAGHKVKCAEFTCFIQYTKMWLRRLFDVYLRVGFCRSESRVAGSWANIYCEEWYLIVFAQKLPLVEFVHFALCMCISTCDTTKLALTQKGWKG